MICLARLHTVFQRPPRLIGASGRPLNFTVSRYDPSCLHARPFVRRAAAAGDARASVSGAFVLEVRDSPRRGSHVVGGPIGQRLPLVRALVLDLRGVSGSAALDPRRIYPLGQSVRTTSYDWRVTFLARSKGLLFHYGWRRASAGVVRHAHSSGDAGGRPVCCRVSGRASRKMAS